MRYNIPPPLIKPGSLYSGGAVGVVRLGRDMPDFKYPGDLKQIYVLLNPGFNVALLLERTNYMSPLISVSDAFLEVACSLQCTSCHPFFEILAIIPSSTSV